MSSARWLALLAALLVLPPPAAADHPGSVRGLEGLLADLAPGEEMLVHRLPTLDAKMAAWEAAWPERVERRTIGESSTGLPLYNVRITDETV
ncbi:MAG TPA: hypothetical protein VHH36_04705, partial [Candidatus Thermoplasmatota archaeon]|nr:hypothetical protein [Candidatus Thermoplasmatota archaeon]